VGRPRRLPVGVEAAENRPTAPIGKDVSGSQLSTGRRPGTAPAQPWASGSTLSASSHGRGGARLSLLSAHHHHSRRPDPGDRPCPLLADRFHGTTATRIASFTSTTTCWPGRAKRVSTSRNHDSSTPTRPPSPTWWARFQVRIPLDAETPSEGHSLVDVRRLHHRRHDPAGHRFLPTPGPRHHSDKH